MNFEIESGEKYLIIKSMVEKLDTAVAPELKSLLVYHSSAGTKNMILDMGNTTYCDSSGLSGILVASRLCKAAAGTFVLADLKPMVMKLVTISQLDNILNITPTVSEAVDFVMMEEVERDISNEG